MLTRPASSPARRGNSVAAQRYAPPVEVLPDTAELTTQQAAEFLNVSRPYLIKVLESGAIPFRLVGTHRRVKFRDLSEYKSRDDLALRRAADELTKLTQELRHASAPP